MSVIFTNELSVLHRDVILIGLDEPDRAGLEDARRIRALIPELKILMMDVPDNDSDVLACIERGAAGYLVQDASVENFISNVQAIAAVETLCSPRIASVAFDVHGL